jgi:hypothetical protein
MDFYYNVKLTRYQSTVYPCIIHRSGATSYEYFQIIADRGERAMRAGILCAGMRNAAKKESKFISFQSGFKPGILKTTSRHHTPGHTAAHKTDLDLERDERSYLSVLRRSV